jgi:Fic family protein
LELREKHRTLITEHLGRAAGNGHRILEHLYKRPIISVKEVRSVTGTSNPAANQLVQKLVEHGIVNEITGQKRNRRFRYESYIRLFEEPEPTVAARA